uniref:Leucine--tRNA ligase RagD-binding domain-containing protein n=1 Tax=Picea sitchensis TaxID=3332 RepID=D5AEC7_PICSI|nr:unknown [Picea sitchensis]
MRKLLQKQTSAPKKAKKGPTNTATTVEESKPTIGLLYVAEKYEGWKEECLKILQAKYDKGSRSFARDQDISAALKESPIGQLADFKIILKQCMPFLRFKKDETLAVGPEALDVKLPFDEMQVLQENVDLIKRQIGLEKLEIFFITDESARNKAGSYVSVLRQTPPSPGNPVAIFMAALVFQQNSARTGA